MQQPPSQTPTEPETVDLAEPKASAQSKGSPTSLTCPTCISPTNTAAFEFSWLQTLFATTFRELQSDPLRTNLLIPPGDDCAEVLLETLDRFHDESLASLADKHPASPDGPIKGSSDRVPGSSVLFASDMLMDGVHFNLKEIHPSWVGAKAVRVNLSDIAAMAGTPLSITVSLALPRIGGASIGQEVMEGVATTCRAYGLTIAGGDTNTWNGPLVISVAILGLPHHKQSLTRHGAQVGDEIFVSGPLGGSLHSGRHLCPEPRLDLARLLREKYAVTSMMDLSDGLGSDLRHILRASNVGACLERRWIPLHRDLFLEDNEALDRRGRFRAPMVLVKEGNPQHTEGNQPFPVGNSQTDTKLEGPERDRLIDKALSDGEDFEICWTMPPWAGAQLRQDLLSGRHNRAPGGLRPLDLSQVAITQIGVITDSSEKLTWTDGSPVLSRGYEHKLDSLRPP